MRHAPSLLISVLAAGIIAVTRPEPIVSVLLEPELRGARTRYRNPAGRPGKTWFNYRGPREAARARRQHERLRQRAEAVR